MLDILVLGASIALQFTAVILAVRLIRIGGWAAAWTVVAAALALMGVRRMVTLYDAIAGAPDFQPNLAAESVALGISFLMVVGVALIRPLFESARSADAAEDESERRVRTMVNSAPVMLWMTDARGKSMFFNQKWLDFVGQTADEVRAETWYEHLHPEDRGRCVQVFRSALKAREGFEMEYRTRRLDGEYRWILDTAVPRFAADGRFEGFIGSNIDITDRKTVEQMLEGRSSVLERLARGASLDEVLDTLVRTAEDFKPELIASVLLLDEKTGRLRHGAGPSLPDFYNEAIDGLAIGPGAGSCGTSAYTRQRVVVEDVMDHPYWTDFRDLAARAGLRACWSEPIMSSSGKVLGTFAMYYREPRKPDTADIEFIKTAAHLAGIAIAQKQTEDELRSSEARLANAQRIAKVGNFERDLLTGEVLWSDELFRIFEIDPETFEKTYDGFLSRVHPEDREFVHARIQMAIRDEGEFNHEYRIVLPGGGEKVLHAQAEVTRDETGRPVLLSGIAQDVTERKRAEEALKAAKEEAEAANRTKSAFLANMSHELRTPLNAIIGFSDIIKDELLGPVGSPKYRDYADDINSSGRLLLDLINDILDFSKAEAGKLVPRDQTVNLATPIESTLRLFRENTATRDLDFVESVAEDLPLVRADERMMKQIVLNLVSNATKFTPKGGTITVSAYLDSGCPVIAVRDTGIGIADTDIPLVMTAFGQADNSLSRKNRGTGLGLPLVKSLAEAHGGTFHLESKVDVGTTAIVRLPASRVVTDDMFDYAASGPRVVDGKG